MPNFVISISRMIQNLTDIFTNRPKLLFLFDCGGAFVTAFFLAVIMRTFNQYFRMPVSILIFLSVIAFCFSVYSFVCFRLIKKGWTNSLRIIAVANLSYCLLTIVFTIKYFSVLSRAGVGYFLIELLIIAGLSYVELRVANRLKAYSLK